MPASGLEEPVAEPVEAPPVDEVTQRNWTPAWILGGVTVASLGTSFVFRGLASGKASEAKRLDDGTDSSCVGTGGTACEELDSAIAKHDTYATVSNVSLIVAGAGAAVTIGYVTYLLTKSDKKPPVQAGLGFDKTGGVLMLSGSL